MVVGKRGRRENEVAADQPDCTPAPLKHISYLPRTAPKLHKGVSIHRGRPQRRWPGKPNEEKPDPLARPGFLTLRALELRPSPEQKHKPAGSGDGPIKIALSLATEKVIHRGYLKTH